MDTGEKWLEWAVALQSIAQAGLFYGKDVYDKERYGQIRAIAAESGYFGREELPPLRRIRPLRNRSGCALTLITRSIGRHYTGGVSGLITYSSCTSQGSFSAKNRLTSIASTQPRFR